MGRHEHYEERSGDSAFLEAFRKRKNERLMSELDLAEEIDIPLPESNEPSRPAYDTSARESVKSQTQRTSAVPERNAAPVRNGASQSNDPYLPPLPQKAEPEKRVKSDPYLSMDDDFADDFSESSSFSEEDSALSSGGNHHFSSHPTTKRTTDASAPLTSKKKSEPAAGGEKQKKKGKGCIIFIFLLLAAAGIGVYLMNGSKNDIANTPDENLSSASSLYDDMVSVESNVVSDTYSSDDVSSEDLSATSNLEVSSDVSSSETTIPFEFKATLRVGSEGEEVKLMQQRLAKLGYISTESCTGYYGDYTKKRIKVFQKNAGLKITGEANKKTLERLFADDAPRFH